jgi:hypothetical protein
VIAREPDPGEPGDKLCEILMMWRTALLKTHMSSREYSESPEGNFLCLLRRQARMSLEAWEPIDEDAKSSIRHTTCRFES